MSRKRGKRHRPEQIVKKLRVTESAPSVNT